MKKILTIFTIIVLMSTSCFSKQEVRSIAEDNHIKIINYNPQSIHKYTGFYGYQSSILFESDETIDTISMGDSTGWQLMPKGNRLFIKPIADNANTNATIITNKRVYYFELHAEEATGLDDARLAYEVRFLYPSTDVNDNSGLDNGGMMFPINQTQIPDLTDIDTARKGINFNYSVSHNRGSEGIVPLKIFDDNRFTYMQFPTVNASLPSIFHIDSEGYESLINFRIVNDYVVIERVSHAFTLRHGSDTVCVFNNHLK
ncbi:P-type conjugative transfer protein VirB9 [Neoehrlichia mikurensis]|uniref:P-type conjugative transfer protein VirB9 n=1 Tax=Neoehrlichia mikurensis TaxID=89586 RepID=A0A9Q9F3C4_9RICK|nr:P-type conjugative transfer protein VirB9 [Neoehrlichia mikurensis]QXK92196.1 P-type conjugative transfer protein VirB9 [Neoehrlichia mikurensis]QXK92652.1 P-type conjugative transfer protein VirB9 [Neoehrlichia mikurensis]QXK93889.1 P-type conjugative transfer protein VirB9 [Neoehrlichia mikurensis]UTO55112.1 P-type conjugative transfer protein VirB9 [Neoehrlichia mikurensis]UTO56032.1 P-type conjugative transfer protein VirB9 [Neoehrlichia mikurensis]